MFFAINGSGVNNALKMCKYLTGPNKLLKSDTVYLSCSLYLLSTSRTHTPATHSCSVINFNKVSAATEEIMRLKWDACLLTTTTKYTNHMLLFLFTLTACTLQLETL